MDIKKIFGERLKNLRETTGLSQNKLAEILNISRVSLSYYENGERTPDIEILDKVSKYFKVTCDYLLGSTDNKSKENIFASEKIGLSDNAIAKLNNVPSELLSKIIEDNEYEYFYNLIRSFVEDKVKIFDEDLKIYKNSNEVAFYRSANVLYNILERIKKNNESYSI